MPFANCKTERGLVSGGYELIAGLDEVGRGSWAGPVVAAAVNFDPLLRRLPRLKDSKMLSRKQREKLFVLSRNFDFGLGYVSPQIIDAINILEATKRAMLEAIGGLRQAPQYLLIDALRLPVAIPQQGIIRGDQKVWCIAAASIIAKVSRDRLLAELHELYPAYGFHRNMGYGTKEHRQALLCHGPCPEHRLSYRPLRQVESTENSRPAGSVKKSGNIV